MAEFIGVTHLQRIKSSLKREALIFNQVGIYDYNDIPDYIRARCDKELLNELDWLMEQGIALNLNYSENVHPILNHPEFIAFRLELKRHKEMWEKIVENAELFLTQYERPRDSHKSSEGQTSLLPQEEKVSLEDDLIAVWQKLIDNFIDSEDVFSRLRCIQLRELEGLDAFPLFHSERFPGTGQVANKADVVQIVVNALPVPDDKTSWEQIMEYRSDPESFGKFLALRRWMTEVAKSNLSFREIEESLEWLLYDYQRHLKLHKMRVTSGAFETMLTVGAEFLENLVKINWGKAAKLLFTLKHRKVELLEAEIKSPGSEVAYILESWKQFGGRT